MNLGEIQMGMAKLKNWSLEGKAIAKEMEFDSFKEAVDFVNRVALVADTHGHFPTMMIESNRVRMYLTTSQESGLSEKDFKLAEEIDKLGELGEG